MVFDKKNKTVQNSNSSRVRTVLLVLFIFFIFYSTVYAASETINDDITDRIFNYYSGNIEILNGRTYSSRVGNAQTFKNVLVNSNKTQFTSLFNAYIESLQTEVKFENIAFCGFWEDTTHFKFKILISYNNSVNENLGNLKTYYFSPFSGAYQWFFEPYISNKPIYQHDIVLNLNTGEFSDLSTSSQPLCNWREWGTIDPFILGLTDSYVVYFENTLYNISNNLNIIFSNPIENSTTSASGYYWFASNKSIKVNRFNGNNTTLDILFYKGNSLNYTYNFYYFSESGDKISVNQYIEEINPTSNETGKNYSYILLREESNAYNSFPDNTNFYLDLKVSNGNEEIIVVENWLAFQTYTDRTGSIIGTTTTTNSNGVTESGEINAEIDLSGIQNGINNISAEFSGDIEDAFPSSGDILQNSGYKEREDPYKGFWLSFISGLNENLLNDENISLEFTDMVGNVRVINSSDFITPNNPMRVFTNTVLTSFLIYQILKFIRQIINGLNEGNINVLHDVDADIYFF